MFARFHLPSFWLTPLPRSVLWPSLMWKLSSLHLFIHQHVVFFLSWLSLLTEWSTLCSFSMFISPWLCPSHFCPPYRNCSIVTLLCLPPFWVFFLSSSPCLSWDAPFSSLQALCWLGIAPHLYLLLLLLALSPLIDLSGECLIPSFLLTYVGSWIFNSSSVSRSFF